MDISTTAESNHAPPLRPLTLNSPGKYIVEAATKAIEEATQKGPGEWRAQDWMETKHQKETLVTTACYIHKMEPNSDIIAVAFSYIVQHVFFGSYFRFIIDQ